MTTRCVMRLGSALAVICDPGLIRRRRRPLLPSREPSQKHRQQRCISPMSTIQRRSPWLRSWPSSVYPQQEPKTTAPGWRSAGVYTTSTRRRPCLTPGGSSPPSLERQPERTGASYAVIGCGASVGTRRAPSSLSSPSTSGLAPTRLPNTRG